MVHKSIIRGYHVYKEVWKPKIGLGSTARTMHDQHAVNSARIRLTASIKPENYVCAYKKGTPNNPSVLSAYLSPVLKIVLSFVELSQNDSYSKEGHLRIA